MTYSTVPVTVEFIMSRPSGTILGWQDTYYYGIARKNDDGDWNFSDYSISDESVADRINESNGWTVLVPEPPLSSPEAVVHVDPDLLESQLRIARLMSHGPLTDEPGA